MNKPINSLLAIAIIVVLASVVGYLAIYNNLISLSLPSSGSNPNPNISENPSTSTQTAEFKEIKKFSSEGEFKQYLEAAAVNYNTSGGTGVVRTFDMTNQALPLASPAPAGKGGGETSAVTPERVSETNIQVAGVDEPDIVKTDGKEIYFSPEQGYYPMPIFMEGGGGGSSVGGAVGGVTKIVPPYYQQPETKLIKAFPPENLAIDSKIENRGDLLLANNILTVFSNSDIYGYDVSDPKSAQQKWKLSLESNNYVVGARLYNNKIYLITGSQINTYNPYPIKPLTIGGNALEIKCSDIYYPTVSVPIDVTYTALILDPVSGKIEKTISFVGSQQNSSIVYMSENAIYVTYSYYASVPKFLSQFVNEKGKDIFPDWLTQKIEKLNTYDISDNAKITELETLFGQYQNSLSDDERLQLSNELTNRMTDYYKEHERDLETTGIVKIGLDGFDVSATGNVPGQPLNQFSLDEYNDYLRIATTVGGQSFGWQLGINVSGESANDVYILDKNLENQGSVKDLGLGERIYSVRFIDDKGYVSTFKQTDPFYVLDLSDPKNPELKGQLKIPGYSAYLHPITKDKILGIGQEGSSVKVSLFDVSDPANPSELDKYNLDEYWSDILNTHHAFLLDTDHQIFFLPGSKGGYIFSYQNDKLKMVKAISIVSAKRAIYLNNYLYVVGDNQIKVVDESNWKDVNSLDLQS